MFLHESVRSRVPEVNVSVLATGDKADPVGMVEIEAIHFVGVFSKRVNTAVVGHVPELDSSVIAARGRHRGPVNTKLCAAHPVAVSHQ